MHLLDVGGVGISGYAPGAHDVWQEGMRFPPVKIIDNGAINEEWEHYIAAPDGPDEEGRAFDNKAHRVLSELWVSPHGSTFTNTSYSLHRVLK